MAQHGGEVAWLPNDKQYFSTLVAMDGNTERKLSSVGTCTRRVHTKTGGMKALFAGAHFQRCL